MRRTRLIAAATAVAALAACKGGDGGTPRTDTALAVAPAARPVPPAAGAPRAATGPANVAPEAKAICGSVATFWSRHDSTDLRQLDSVLTTYASDTAVSACIVLVWQAHGMKRDSAAHVDTAAQHLETALALVRGAGPGWVPLYRFGADGPDGSSLAYQRGRVRCLVEQTWDGGDDSDSTYVPADWFKEQTTCWMMPTALTVSDTAH